LHLVGFLQPKIKMHGTTNIEHKIFTTFRILLLLHILLIWLWNSKSRIPWTWPVEGRNMWEQHSVSKAVWLTLVCISRFFLHSIENNTSVWDRKFSKKIFFLGFSKCPCTSQSVTLRKKLLICWRTIQLYTIPISQADKQKVGLTVSTFRNPANKQADNRGSCLPSLWHTRR